MIFFKNQITGFTILTFLTALSFAVAPSVPALGTAGIAILFGMLFGNTLKVESIYHVGSVAEKRILPIAIALIGINLNIFKLFNLGIAPLISIIILMAITFAVAIILGRFLKIKKDISLLMGGGNAVCGSSAVGAIAPLTSCSQAEIGLTIATVNLMGTIGIFLLTFICTFFHFEENSSAFFIGGILQAVGHVVAAGDILGDSIRDIAIVIKMGRVVLLGPIIILLSLILNKKNRPIADKKDKSFPIPLFIIIFFILSILGSQPFFPEPLKGSIHFMGEVLLTFAMVGIGANIRFKSILKLGMPILLLGVGIFTAQIVGSFLIIKLLF